MLEGNAELTKQGVFGANAIHGYNLKYRATEVSSGDRFHAFNMNQSKTRPESFVSQKINDVNILDHQGHIFPQSKIIPPLKKIADGLYEWLKEKGNYTPKEACSYFEQSVYKDLNFDKVCAYIQVQLIDNGHASSEVFFNTEADTAEEFLDGFFSVVVWNPVNICRAPDDKVRGGQPGDQPDDQVIDKLLSDPNSPLITLPEEFALYLGRYISVKRNFIFNDFIKAINGCLNNDRVGYYKFNWALNPAS